MKGSWKSLIFSLVIMGLFIICPEECLALPNEADLTLNTSMTGQLSSETDVDYYKFTLPSAGKVSVNFCHIPVSSGDWEIQIWDAQLCTRRWQNLY